MDGGSTDNSVEIIKKYEKHLAWWASEPDRGMYDAVNKGFQRSNGEIMAYLNSDDMYHRKSLFTMAQIFNDIPDVAWVQGAQTFYNDAGQTVRVLEPGQYSKYRYYSGDFSWIQQESTFWRRTLWEKAGGYINPEKKLAGDLDLWMRFFKHEQLYTANVLVGGYRMRGVNQLAHDNMSLYFKEGFESLKEISLTQAEKRLVFLIKVIRKFDKSFAIFKSEFFRKHLFERFHKFPPSVIYNKQSMKFELIKILNKRTKYGLKT